MQHKPHVINAAICLACATPVVAGGEWDCGQWTQIAAPNPANSVQTWLTDVDALSPDDAWAVGYFKVELGPFITEHYTYILHWKGKQWQHIPSPSPGLPYEGGTQCYLEGVEAIAPDDVWAVGHFKTQQSHGHVGPQPLTLHWDGDEWSIVPAPQSQGESSGAILFDIDAIASDDIWAGGIWPSPAGYGFPAFMLHWNGSQWTVHQTPNAAYSQKINAIKAFASDDVWAVGGSGNSHATSYVIHFDGSSWSQVSAPSPSFWNFLRDIDGASPNDIWIAGEQWDTDISYQPLMLHYDGAAWTQVPSPGGGQSIVAVAADDVWSADTWTTGSSIAHYDGVSWTVRATVAGPTQSTLLGMTKVAQCDLWAVGREVNSDPGFLPLIQRFQLAGIPVPGDITGDGVVNINDLLAAVNAWGPCCSPPGDCPADVAPSPEGDGFVNINDLLLVINNWS